MLRDVSTLPTVFATQHVFQVTLHETAPNCHLVCLETIGIGEIFVTLKPIQVAVQTVLIECADEAHFNKVLLVFHHCKEIGGNVIWCAAGWADVDDHLTCTKQLQTAIKSTVRCAAANCPPSR